MDETVPPDRDPVTLTEGEGETLEMPEGLGSIASGQVFEMAGRGAGMVIRLRLKATQGQGRIRNSEFGIRISAQPHRSLGSLRSLGMTGIGSLEKTCHPERGRPTAESKDPPTSPESVPELGSLSSFGGSLDSQSSLGMTGIGSLKKTCHPDRTNSGREPRSGDRYLAWGVSPRYREQKIEKPRRGDRCAAHD